MTVTRRTFSAIALIGVISFAVVGLLSVFVPTAHLDAQTGAPVTCGSSVAVNTAAAATGELVALSATKRIYVCNFTIVGAGTSQVTLVQGTGTNCGTGTTSLTGAMSVATATSVMGSGVNLPVGKALCLTNGQAVQVSGFVSYRQY